MRKIIHPAVENCLIQGDVRNGAFLFDYAGGIKLRVICSDGGGWDHVSVSLQNRCPNWEEMCYIKNLFFAEEETVVQFHPKKSEYVRNHPHVLHMWRNQKHEHELPPRIFVGFSAEELADPEKACEAYKNGMRVLGVEP